MNATSTKPRRRIPFVAPFAIVVGLVVACGSGSSRDEDFPIDACVESTDCPRNACICKMGDGTESTVRAAVCRNERCLPAADMCSAACQQSTPPGTWTGRVDSSSTSPDASTDASSDAAPDVAPESSTDASADAPVDAPADG